MESRKEKAIEEIVLVAFEDLAMMTDIICDKHDIPKEEREDVRRRVIKDFSAYGKIAVNIVDTLKELT